MVGSLPCSQGQQGAAEYEAPVEWSVSIIVNVDRIIRVWNSCFKVPY